MSWGGQQVRAGAHYCPAHGQVRPRQELVPACPQCGRAAHVGVRVGGQLLTQEPRPAACRQGHRLDGGQVLLSTRACSCALDGAHRTWTCRACGDVQMWPPHDEAGADPYFGPGWRG